MKIPRFEEVGEEESSSVVSIQCLGDKQLCRSDEHVKSGTVLHVEEGFAVMFLMNDAAGSIFFRCRHAESPGFAI